MIGLKVYTIAIPNLPDPILQRDMADKFAGYIGGLSGFVGLHPVFPRGTILAFATVEDARNAWHEISDMGNKCGDYIMCADLDDDTLTVGRVC